ncbi:catecholate siderophore receptor Fiu [Lysobacter sp. A03]|uniref:catecholate siderophore receptor Fiu n=1 Tax=Lysobacter sp. A03 TaxID=1199154 RepID=UPI0005B73480|nr:catecholate siderophore receptor Fiu [Lysobacter sp. A03]KIQ97074.1 Ferrichrome-iron receptor [Lysobacter sp. A03]
MSPITSRKHAVAPPKTGSTHHSSLSVSLLTGLVLAAPLAASAQSASGPAADATDFDTVRVEGKRGKVYSSGQLSSPKFSQPLLDTTQTINVIGSDLFNEQGATNLTEALRNSPGVGTFYAGENGNTTTGDAIYLRGFDTSGSIFVDGVRDLGSISRDVFNIEQIEVAKGPAGTDNGRTAPTGAINLVSKQAHGHDRASVTGSYGSADQKRVTADWNKTLGDTSALRLNLMVQDSGVPGRDTIENKRWAIAPSLAFGLGTDTRTTLNLLHIQQDNLPDGGVPTIGLPGYSSPDPTRPQFGDADPVASSNFYGTLSDYDDVTADMATLRIEHDLSDATRLINTTRWGSTKQDYLLTAFMGTAANLVTPDLDDPAGWTVARSLPTFKNQRNKIITNQTAFATEFDAGGVRHDFTTGLELTREELDTQGMRALDGTAWPAVNLYQPSPDVTGLQWQRNGARGEGRTDTVAAYVFDTLTLNEQWQVNGGLRADRYKTQFQSTVPCGGRRGPDCGILDEGSIVPGVDARISDTLLNWKVGALYKPVANASFYANYAVAQQPPGGGNLELSDSENSANNPALDPQKARTAEVGTKWNVLDQRLMLTAALYDTRISNEVVRDPVDQQYYQTGRKRVRGVELSAVGQITDVWSVSTGFTVMDTDVLSGPVVTTDGSSDLTYTPKRAFTAWSTYDFPNGLTIGGGARYSGELKRGVDGAVGTPAYTKDYWVVDAVASCAVSPNLDLRLNLYNLLDKDYVAAINKSGYRYTPGTPRSMMFTVNYHF